jgi:hypothetical protein
MDLAYSVGETLHLRLQASKNPARCRAGLYALLASEHCRDPVLARQGFLA